MNEKQSSENQKRILVVEDDPTIMMGLRFSLEKEGYLVEAATNKQDALKLINNQQFHLAVLDVSLPDGTGFELCNKLKETTQTAVLFLTASDEEKNVVLGLELGAEDYVTKPFRLKELLLRIKNILLRTNKPADAVLIGESLLIGNLSINLKQALIKKNNQEIPLSALEFRLLEYLVRHQGVMLSRNQLLEYIWDMAGNFVNDNTLTVYIKRLREKIEDDPAHPQIIVTVRGLGYKIP